MKDPLASSQDQRRKNLKKTHTKEFLVPQKGVGKRG